MTTRRSRLAAILRVAKMREDEKTAAHERRLRGIEQARQLFISAQHRAQPGEADNVDELQRQRAKSASSARTALAAESHLQEHARSGDRDAHRYPLRDDGAFRGAGL